MVVLMVVAVAAAVALPLPIEIGLRTLAILIVAHAMGPEVFVGSPERQPTRAPLGYQSAS